MTGQWILKKEVVLLEEKHDSSFNKPITALFWYACSYTTETSLIQQVIRRPFWETLDIKHWKTFLWETLGPVAVVKQIINSKNNLDVISDHFLYCMISVFEMEIVCPCKITLYVTGLKLYSIIFWNIILNSSFAIVT